MEITNFKTLPARGYDNYIVTSDGRIFSKSRYVAKYTGRFWQKGHWMKISKIRYAQTNLGYKNPVLVHRIVAETFIPREKDKTEVNHIDGNKLNNSVENLEWCTRSENTQHAFDTGLNVHHKGDRSRNAKITFKIADSIRSEYAKGYRSQKDIGSEYGIHQSTVSKIITGRKWVNHV